MRNTVRHWVSVGAFCLLGAALGCAKVPPCTVSPVEIEETREDAKILDKDLEAAKGRAKELSDELAQKQAELDGKKDKPGELRKKLDDLKKGSGRGDDQKKKDEKESA